MASFPTFSSVLKCVTCICFTRNHLSCLCIWHHFPPVLKCVTCMCFTRHDRSCICIKCVCYKTRPVLYFNNIKILLYYTCGFIEGWRKLILGTFRVLIIVNFHSSPQTVVHCCCVPRLYVATFKVSTVNLAEVFKLEILVWTGISQKLTSFIN